MLTPRNVFITTLAISDILLCTFTMPLTCIDVLGKYWPWGPEMSILCKMIGTIQASCVFFSSFSILLVALDRYRFILHPSQTQLSNTQAFLASCLAFLLSVTLSTPIFVITKLKIRKTPFTDKYFSFCYEVSWTLKDYPTYFLSLRTGVILTTGCRTLSSASSSSSSFPAFLCVLHT